jgi:hypothetical protein
MGKFKLMKRKLNGKAFRNTLLAILMVILPGGFALGGAYIVFGYLQARLRRGKEKRDG